MNLVPKIVGYRTEDYGGSMERDIRSVLDYEVNELGNHDVMNFISSVWGIDNPTIDSVVRMLEESGVTNAVWLCRSAKDCFIHYILCEEDEDIDVEPFFRGDNDDLYQIDRYTIEDGVVLCNLGSYGMLVGYNPENLTIEENINPVSQCFYGVGDSSMFTSG
ncbi:MAG: hypothetical protein D6732_21440 [Methanobacteriota archaeon]|nr:MAG: hypothetical protein D6732_21440 [Euryarchaeota archaeon]